MVKTNKHKRIKCTKRIKSLSLVTSGFSSVQQFIVNQVKNIDKLY